MQNKKYGEYGGQYVAESLMSVLAELETAYNEAINDPKFIEEYNYYLKEYVGRETPLYFAEKLSKKYGTKIYLKREDLNHTGAHKINNTIGQILLARRIRVLQEERTHPSLPAQEQASMVWLLRQEQHCLIWNVPYLWAKKIWNARH